MRTFLKGVARQVPMIDRLITARDELSAERDRLLCDLDALRTSWEQMRLATAEMLGDPHWAPAGHLRKPVAAHARTPGDEASTQGPLPRSVPGVDLRESEQFKLLNDLLVYYRTGMPFRPEKTEGLRYYFENSAYSYSDAILSHCMIRSLQPRRIVEVGSGFSSCMILDTNELFFGGSIATTFIDPHPGVLRLLIKESDVGAIRMLPLALQDADPGEFDALERNDIVFVDLTHPRNVGSDVGRIASLILPRLASGVHVHFHGIAFPFVHPKRGAHGGSAWNEAHLLRAFLEHNTAFRVVLMNTFMQHFHAFFFQRQMPLCLKNTGGSIWIRKE